MGNDWRQDILNEQDFMKAQKEKLRKAELWEQYLKLLLLSKNEEALRKFLMRVARVIAEKGLAGRLGAEGWVDYYVNRLRKNKKIREDFIRGWSE